MEPESILRAAMLEAVNRNLATEKTQEMIDKRVTSLISEVIDDAFRSYSEFGKELRSIVANALKIEDGYKLDLPSYGQTIMAAMRAQIEEIGETLINQKLATQMQEMLSITSAELKLSTVVEAMRESAKEHAREYRSSLNDRVTCLVVPNTGSLSEWCDVYLDVYRKTSEKECTAHMTITGEGKIFRLVIEGKDAGKTIRFSVYDEWQKLLFAAFASGSKFIVDEDAVYTSLDED